MKELVVDFNQQGKTLIFSMTLGNERRLKDEFPNAAPVKVMLWLRNGTFSVIDSKTKILNYIIPMLTGLEMKDIKKIPEISVINRPEHFTYFTTSPTDVEEK